MGLSGNYVFFSPLYNFKLIKFNIPIYMDKNMGSSIVFYPDQSESGSYWDVTTTAVI